MDILQHYNITRFMGFVPTIRKTPKDWRIIEAALTGKTHHNIALIAKKMQVFFEGKEGVIFICNSRELVALVRTGDTDTETLSKNINDNMPAHSCFACAGDTTADGLLTIQVKFQEMPEIDGQEASPLLKTRQQREQNIIMVVDDDSLIRSTISKAFAKRAQVIEADDMTDIVETYLEFLPDIVFLDIHLTEKHGIELLEEIKSFDSSAYVVIISADSKRDNVLDAKKLGAKGFLAKPFDKERLDACFNKCPTTTMPAHAAVRQ